MYVHVNKSINSAWLFDFTHSYVHAAVFYPTSDKLCVIQWCKCIILFMQKFYDYWSKHMYTLIGIWQNNFYN